MTHNCDNCSGIDPASCMFNQTAPGKRWCRNWGLNDCGLEDGHEGICTPKPSTQPVPPEVLREAVEALRFYANWKNWAGAGTGDRLGNEYPPNPRSFSHAGPMSTDMGDRARAVLKALDEKA